MALSLRQATQEDLPTLEKIENASFQDPWSSFMLASELQEPNTYYAILSEKGEDVGFYGIMTVLDEAHILNIAVLPEYRGRGFGNALMQDLLLKAKELGGNNVTLEVRASNLPAIALYRKFGFEFAGVRPRYYGDEDALIFWLYR